MTICVLFRVRAVKKYLQETYDEKSRQKNKMQTWLTEKVVGINNDGRLPELVDGKAEQLI